MFTIMLDTKELFENVSYVDRIIDEIKSRLTEYLKLCRCDVVNFYKRDAWISVQVDESRANRVVPLTEEEIDDLDTRCSLYMTGIAEGIISVIGKFGDENG